MDRGFRYRWLAGLLTVAMLALVGVSAYNLGVAHGIAESGRLIAASVTARRRSRNVTLRVDAPSNVAPIEIS